MNKTTVNFTIEDGGEATKFIAERLNPEKQFKLILKLIGIIAKGSISNSRIIEQALHNKLQTGKTIEGADKEKLETPLSDAMRDAIKGAIASLSDIDRDFIFSELLSTVKFELMSAPGGAVLASPSSLTWVDLNLCFDTFIGPLKLFNELITLNFGFFLKEKA